VAIRFILQDTKLLEAGGVAEGFEQDKEDALSLGHVRTLAVFVEVLETTATSGALTF